MNAIRVALERTPPELQRRYQRPRHRADRRRRADQESGQAHPRGNRPAGFDRRRSAGFGGAGDRQNAERFQAAAEDFDRLRTEARPRVGAYGVAPQPVPQYHRPAAGDLRAAGSARLAGRKTNSDVRLIRVWAVTAVTPLARVVEAVRSGSAGFLHNYIHAARCRRRESPAARRSGPAEDGQHFPAQSSSVRPTAPRRLQIFQAAHAFEDAGRQRHRRRRRRPASKVVYVDRGSIAGVQRGMAVVTPDGIVGKVIAAYPTASLVLLVTDPDFAAGVISQKNQVRGTLKGPGERPRAKSITCRTKRRWRWANGSTPPATTAFFPRGFPVGVVKAVRDGQPFKEILVEPSGVQHGLEDVLIILPACIRRFRTTPPANQTGLHRSAPPAASSAATPMPVALPRGDSVQSRRRLLKPTVCASTIRLSATRRIMSSAKTCRGRSRRISICRCPPPAPQRQLVQRLLVAAPHRPQRDLLPRPAQKAAPRPPARKALPALQGCRAWLPPRRAPRA